MNNFYNRTVETGDVFKIYINSLFLGAGEIPNQTVAISRGDKILVLKKDGNLCKLLILTGKQAGRICYENSNFISSSVLYEKLEMIT